MTPGEFYMNHVKEVKRVKTQVYVIFHVNWTWRLFRVYVQSLVINHEERLPEVTQFSDFLDLSSVNCRIITQLVTRFMRKENLWISDMDKVFFNVQSWCRRVLWWVKWARFDRKFGFYSRGLPLGPSPSSTACDISSVCDDPVVVEDILSGTLFS